MEIFKTSAHQFDDINNLPFSREQYSRMKFGCIQTADICGKELADAFIRYMELFGINKQIVVSASPYQEMQKSSHHLFVPFVKYLNRYLFERGLERVLTTSISRNHVYKIEYSSLSQEDREKNLGKGPMHFNEKLLQGSHFVLIDDLRMTGTVEKNILRQIKNQNLDGFDLHLLYYVENIAPNNIYPSFENELNFSAIPNIDAFIGILKNGANWNMRSLKYILELPFETMLYFFNEVLMFDRNIVENFYDLMIASNVYTIESYKENINMFISYFNIVKNDYVTTI